MKFNELNATANKNRKRAGRGIAAGRGKTAGRGTKGQNARSGGKRRPGFEGGQTPLVQRIPKVRGFKSIAKSQATITTDQLQKVKAAKINFSTLKAEKVISAKFSDYKVVLGKEKLTKKLDVTARAASKSAKEAIEKAGGKFTSEAAAPIAASTKNTKSKAKN